MRSRCLVRHAGRRGIAKVELDLRDQPRVARMLTSFFEKADGFAETFVVVTDLSEKPQRLGPQWAAVYSLECLLQKSARPSPIARMRLVFGGRNGASQRVVGSVRWCQTRSLLIQLGG